MRLRTSLTLLLVTTAGLTALSVTDIEPAASPATDAAVVLVIADTTPAPYDCPYL